MSLSWLLYKLQFPMKDMDLIIAFSDPYSDLHACYTCIFQYKIRDIQVDGFISKTHDYKIPGYGDFESTVMLYFMSVSWINF